MSYGDNQDQIVTDSAEQASKLKQVLAADRLGEREKKWYPVWADRFANHLQDRPPETATPAELIEFVECQSKQACLPWQLMQAIDAITYLVTRVYGLAGFEAADLKRRWSKTASAPQSSNSNTSLPAQPDEPVSERAELVDNLRKELRLRHYAIRTEKAYADWFAQFLRFHESVDPRHFGASDVKLFLELPQF